MLDVMNEAVHSIAVSVILIQRQLKQFSGGRLNLVPSENVTGFDRTSGSIYTEVIKYSTLLKRAELRNKIFIDKLDGK